MDNKTIEKINEFIATQHELTTLLTEETHKLTKIIEDLTWQMDNLRAAALLLLPVVPSSNDMRLLHVVAFNQTTTDYDELDNLKENLREAVAETGYLLPELQVRPEETLTVSAETEQRPMEDLQ